MKCLIGFHKWGPWNSTKVIFGVEDYRFCGRCEKKQKIFILEPELKRILEGREVDEAED